VRPLRPPGHSTLPACAAARLAVRARALACACSAPPATRAATGRWRSRARSAARGALRTGCAPVALARRGLAETGCCNATAFPTPDPPLQPRAPARARALFSVYTTFLTPSHVHLKSMRFRLREKSERNRLVLQASWLAGPQLAAGVVSWRPATDEARDSYRIVHRRPVLVIRRDMKRKIGPCVKAWGC